MSDDKTEATTALAPSRDPMERPFVLRVESGPDVGATRKVTSSDTGRVLVGKSHVCDLLLSDRAVSRRHFYVELDDGKLHLVDAGSTNGTRVDGLSVKDALLVGGERIDVGTTTLRVLQEEPTPRSAAPVRDAFELTLGRSGAMRRLYPLCERLAASDLSFIIEGETGTGKEQMAESIHLASARRRAPFVVFDCTAVAPSLVEAELFGHARGAFTGAVESRAGIFEQAQGGTLLIDEIGDLPFDLQPKLLRVLERRQVTRVGGQGAIALDVRIMAATRRDLDREVQHGRFRDDLYHRLAVARLELPPLRERHGDVELLAQHFYEEIAPGKPPLFEAQLARWRSHAWPGNVRELRNAVARWVALGDYDESELAAPHRLGTLRHLDHRDPFGAVLALRLPLSDARERVVEAFERRYLEAILEEHRGNVTHASAAAGVGRRYFQRLKRRLLPEDEA